MGQHALNHPTYDVASEAAERHTVPVPPRPPPRDVTDADYEDLKSTGTEQSAHKYIGLDATTHPYSYANTNAAPTGQEYSTGRR